MECVILWRNTGNGRVGYIHEDDSDEIAVFQNEDEAVALSETHSLLQAMPFQIVELGEL